MDDSGSETLDTLNRIRKAVRAYEVGATDESGVRRQILIILESLEPLSLLSLLDPLIEGTTR